jgi:hypothetical protein
LHFEIPYTSKEPNPNAGNQVYYQQLGPSPTFIQTEAEIQGFDHRLSSYKDGIYVYTFLDEEATKALEYMRANPDKFTSVKINKSVEVQELYSICPEGSHLYEYDKEFQVTCEACNESFPWTELEQDEYYDFYTDAYTDSKCPKCGEWDCCKIRFQT